MNQEQSYFDVVIVGAGLAGLVTAYELLDSGKRLALVDAAPKDQCGGQARDAFGGFLLSGTDEQKKQGIQDSPALFWRDWQQASGFDDLRLSSYQGAVQALSKQGDHPEYWAQAWAHYYIEHHKSEVYDWLKDLGIRFVPSVQWVERGLHGDGNSVPRYHVAWGCGVGLVETLLQAIAKHPHADRLTWFSSHQVDDIQRTSQEGYLCQGQRKIKKNEQENSEAVTKETFSLSSQHLVIASGGISGCLQQVRQHWDRQSYGEPPLPGMLLAGAHPHANGSLLEPVQKLQGQIQHLHWMWNYPAGIAHPKPHYPEQGLSLIPPRSALWLDAQGRRIGPEPLVTGYDTHHVCHRLGKLPHDYTWMVMNRRIMDKELSISGSESNPHFRNKQLLGVLWQLLRGNRKQTQWLIESSDDVITAATLEELADKMQAHSPAVRLHKQGLLEDIRRYDAMVAQPTAFHNDEQLMRLEQLRQWSGDRMRLCKHQHIEDNRHGPLIAIRLRLITRKSMGGVLTNVQSQVLDKAHQVIPHLYAVGEVAGFGGSGMAGKRSLEGTFLSGCILTARQAAKAIQYA